MIALPSIVMLFVVGVVCLAASVATTRPWTRRLAVGVALADFAMAMALIVLVAREP